MALSGLRAQVTGGDAKLAAIEAKAGGCYSEAIEATSG